VALSRWKKSEEGLTNLQAQLRNLDNSRLRGTATRYTMQFLQCVEKLLAGTLEGNPGINGQTLDEEKTQDETGDWVDADFVPIRFDPNEWKIPHASSKLYGGQQFERLLSEFRAVVEHQSIGKITIDDIATAAGPVKLGNASNVLWVASDIAQRQIQRTLTPLLDQLFKRASYSLKRLAVVVDSMMESQRKTKRRAARDQEAALDEVDSFPFFTHNVRDLYFKFIDDTAELCKKKCRDEFHSTRLIYWELNNLSGKKDLGKLDNKEDAKKAVVKLASETFQSTRDRISKNILLKTFNFFLVPMQTSLWADIQGAITCLTEEQLEELFEVKATRQRLQDAETDMQAILQRFGQQEAQFLELASTFAKASPREHEL